MEKKEAMKILKDFYDKSALFSIRTALDTIIPELKENEDEKIRKELIQYLEEYPHLPNGHYCRADFFDWIKKQNSITRLSEKERDRFAKNILKRCALSFIDYLDAHKYESKLYVSNEEREHIINAFYNAMWDKLHRFYCKYIGKYDNKPQGKSALEAINEEKIDNANKVVVEPKFHEGEWVVYGDEDVDLITGLCDKGYEVNDCAYIPFGCEDDMRYWTIQDAKDGDVLVKKKDERPFIFKGLLNINHSEYPVAYYGIDVMDNFISASSYNMWTNKEVCPATKEQRDALMKAMADAGYTFDFDKKELKKIEQKTAWSEEDENRFRNLTFLVEHSNDGKGTKEGFVKFINRLKSIRPQNAWKPSDEQMEALHYVTNFDYGGHKATLVSLYEQLKKLK